MEAPPVLRPEAHLHSRMELRLRRSTVLALLVFLLRPRPRCRPDSLGHRLPNGAVSRVCPRDGMGYLMKNRVGHLPGLAVRCVPSCNLDDLRLLEARTEPSLRGAEAQRPLFEPMRIHECARFLGDFGQTLRAPGAIRTVPVPKRNVGHVPPLLRAMYPGSLRIEFLDGAPLRRPVPSREDNVVADLEADLRPVEVGHNRAQRRPILHEEVLPANPQPGSVLTQHGGVCPPAFDHVSALAVPARVDPHHGRPYAHSLVRRWASRWRARAMRVLAS